MSSHGQSSKGKGKAVSRSGSASATNLPVRNLFEQFSSPDIGDVLGAGFEDQHYDDEGPTPGSRSTAGPGPVERSSTSNLRSDIFAVHFEKVFNDRHEITHAQCKYCSNQYKFRTGGGYGTMHRHLASKHPNKIGHNRTQTQILFETAQGDPKSQEMALFQFSQAQYREEMAETIAVERLPFNFCEKLKLNQTIKRTLQPAANPISRRTMQRTLWKQFKAGKQTLCEYFATSSSSISLCSDIWTDNMHENSYMGITCHWIEDWILQKRVLAFREFNDSHTAHNIQKLITSVIEEFNLTSKIFSISFDNAAANTKSIKQLEAFFRPFCGGKFFHIRCACHVLNLCVQSGLESLKEHIGPIRDVVHYMRGKMNIMKQWGRYCRAHRMKAKSFPKDVKTRWNSTYRLLNETWPYKELLTSFVNENFTDFYLVPDNWEIAHRIMKLLSAFYTATNMMSQVYFPIAHLFIYTAVEVVEQFYKFKRDSQIIDGLCAMKQKWISYYSEIPPVALVAFILDPRQKIDGLENYLRVYYRYLGFKTPEQVVAEIDSQWYNNPIIDVGEIVREARRYLQEVYEFYCQKYRHLMPQVPELDPIDEEEPDDPSLLQPFRLRSARKRPMPFYEVDVYLNTLFWFSTEEAADMNFNILEWWKNNGRPYPILSCLVRDILACPMSTVACEQTFSASGNQLDDSRSQLKPENLEMIVCIDDWQRAQIRQQEAETVSPEVSDFFFTDNASSTATEGRTDPEPEDDDNENDE